jgi:small-conductance mechanosensitive channel
MQHAVTEAVGSTPAIAAPGWGVTALVLVTTAVITLLLRRAAQAPALRRWERWFNPLVAGAWLVATWVLAQRLLAADTLPTAAGRVAIVVVLLVMLAPFVRDVLAAAVISFEGRHGVNDDVRVMESEGRIVEMGLRAVVLRARDGTESTIPNHRFLSSEVVRLNLGVRDAPCEFEVVLPPGRTVEAETRRLLEAAMLSPFAAPGWLPEVFVVAGDDGELRLRVRAYVFDRSYEERYRGDILARFEAGVEDGASVLTSANDRP